MSATKKPMTARELRKLPIADRRKVLAKQAEKAAPYYADMAPQSCRVAIKNLRVEFVESKPEPVKLTAADALLLEKLHAFDAAEKHEAKVRMQSEMARASVAAANDRAAAVASRVLECSTAKSDALSALTDVLKSRPDQRVKFGDSTFVYVSNVGIRRFVGEPLTLPVQQSYPAEFVDAEGRN